MYDKISLENKEVADKALDILQQNPKSLHCVVSYIEFELRLWYKLSLVSFCIHNQTRHSHSCLSFNPLQPTCLSTVFLFA
jgi:hypothetical protein